MHYDHDIRVGIALFILATLFWLVIAPAKSNEWADLERIHNSGEPMTLILSDWEAKEWERMFQEGRGHAVIDGIWSKKKPSIGVARWTLTGHEKQKGWIVATRKNGKIVSTYYTEYRPKKSRTAWMGQGADSATTAVGLGMGFVESNPLLGGMTSAGIAAAKLGATAAVSQASVNTCAKGLGGLGTLGWAASAWNLGVIAGAGPYSAIPALAAGAYIWLREDAVWQCVPDDVFPALAVASR